MKTWLKQNWFKIGALKAFILLLIFVPFVASADVFSRDLYFGIQSDPDVIKLQEFLTSQNVYTGPITGNFFSLTLQGVKKFQELHGIIPAAGYFGPITRAKVNLLADNDIAASNDQAVQETGSLPPPPAPNAVQQQLDALLQQVSLLQGQLATMQNLEAKVQEQTNIIQQQQQTLQQIQQNTTPPPTQTYIPPPAPEVKKEILIEYVGKDLSVAYQENGVNKDGVEITITSNPEMEFGTLIKDPTDPTGKGTKSIILPKSATQITGLWKQMMRNLPGNAYFQLVTTNTASHTITILAEGVEKSFRWQ